MEYFPPGVVFPNERERRAMLTQEEAKTLETLMGHQEAVFRICLGFSRNPSDAEDLAQDVYLKAFRKIATIRNPNSHKEWLFRVARNVCLDYQKKTRKVRLFPSRDENLEASVRDEILEDPDEDGDRLKKLKRAVARLPRKQKEVLVLREYGHFSYQELARTLQIKEGTVMSRLNRARRAVLKLMKEDADGKA
jgi:RNA polymerase sigma-70 factor (ECF subfamily)